MNKKKTKGWSFLGVLFFVFAAGLMLAGVQTRAVSAASVYTYASDYFDEEYSGGYFQLSGGTPSSALKSNGQDSYGYYMLVNTSKSTSIYMTFSKGLVMNGVSYDVRIYYWVSGSNNNGFGLDYTSDDYCGVSTTGELKVRSNTSRSSVTVTMSINCEVHAYEAGTSTETSVKGILGCTDIDLGERMTVTTSAGVWLASPTTIELYSSNAVQGTETNSYESSSSYSVTEKYAWFEFSGTASNPLKIVLTGYGGKTGASTTAFWVQATINNSSAVNVNYKLAGTVPSAAQTTSFATKCTYYSFYNILTDSVTESIFSALTGYDLNYWYSDSACSTESESLIQVKTSDITLYAKYVPHTYTIVYDGNPPDGASGSVSGSTASTTGVTYDTSVNLTANGFSLTGWTWTGWNTKSDGSGTSYADKEAVKNLTAEDGAAVTLYAQWELTSADVSVTRTDTLENILAGAMFDLYLVSDDGNTLLESGITADDGTILLECLDAGTYLLVETETPVGYYAAEDTEFTITEEDYGTTAEIYVKSDPLAALPETGGTGALPFILAGLLGIGAGALPNRRSKAR